MICRLLPKKLNKTKNNSLTVVKNIANSLNQDIYMAFIVENDKNYTPNWFHSTVGMQLKQLIAQCLVRNASRSTSGLYRNGQNNSEIIKAILTYMIDNLSNFFVASFNPIQITTDNINPYGTRFKPTFPTLSAQEPAIIPF